jgi:RNA polymerase sigma factor (sigma-70 family)
MQGQILNNIGEPVVTIASSCDSAADERLVVAAAKNGDELAFESLFKRHQRSIFALALRYTRGREDAEDVVQETFQKAFVHLQKFEGNSSLSTWLTRIAINQALMLLRSRRGQHELPIDDSSSHEATPALELADTSPDPEASCLQAEKAQSLSAAMRQLRPGMREAIELRELGELSNRDTAAHMGVSIGTVKARVFQARRKLAKTLRLHMRPPRICASDSRITLATARKIA